MADEKPIIVIKKKGGHGGHHGGAWKVAYADFVTAMMAFFMVMWLVNTADQSTKQNIASYFKRPGLFEHGSGTPLMIGAAGILEDGIPPNKSRNKKNVAGELQTVQKKVTGEEEPPQDKQLKLRGEKARGLLAGEGNTMGFSDKENNDTRLKIERQRRVLKRIADQIAQQMGQHPELKKMLGLVDVKVEADGLNIEIMDTENTSMFASGSARISSEAEEAFNKIATILKDLPYKLDIAGHTDSKPFSNKNGGYSNWELSGDRANAARRLLEKSGIEPARITSVIGKADKQLRDEKDPLAPTNRRITLKLRIPVNESVTGSQVPDALEKVPDNVDPESFFEEEEVHSLTPQEVIELQQDGRVPILLPDSTPHGENGEQKKKDLIFGDHPVLGPPQPFSNF